jgi:hypothetical protein
MKKILLNISMLTFILSFTTQAQSWKSDSVNLGVGITNDVWYSLENGTVKSTVANNWIIALETHSQTAGAWANCTKGVRVFNAHKNAASFGSVALADTTTSSLQFNSDYTWERGAMNVNRLATDTFDYGWGKYDQPSHNVYGDSVYIVNQGPNFYKIIIDSLIGATQTWHIRVAGIQPSFPAIPYTFTKSPGFDTSNFIYITAGSTGLSAINREPTMNSWDVQFGKYIEVVPVQTGFAPYPVTGALSNYKTLTSRVSKVPIEDIPNYYFTYPSTTDISNIGSDWKVFDGTAYNYPDSLSYVIKTKLGNYYQIKFTEYSSATGYIKFKQRKLTTALAIENQQKSIGFTLAPNPASNDAIVIVESKNTSKALLTLVSSTGQVIVNKPIEINIGLNTWQLDLNNIAAGSYIVTINGASIKASQSLIKN